MAAEPTFTWDIASGDGGARRPAHDDVDAEALIDDSESPPPRDGTYPYADQLKQGLMQATAAAQMVDSAKMTIGYSGATPVIVFLKTPGRNLTAADFAVAAVGTGHFTITWDTDKLPPAGADPTVTANALSDTVGVATIAVGSPGATQTRVTVQTRTGGALANVRCTVRLD